MSRAYCNLGLAHLATGNHESVLECQKYFLAIAQTTKESDSRFRALGNMGDVLIKMDSLEEAIEVYHKQLSLSKQLREKSYEASSYGSLGICHRLTKQFDKALGFHTQELSILQKTWVTCRVSARPTATWERSTYPSLITSTP